MKPNPIDAANRHEAHEVGRSRPDLCWILTDRDVWVRNPHYTGAPEPHPEDFFSMIDGYPAADNRG